MIIECINCNKRFNVDQNLIPNNGREIQCGSCNHSWYYNIGKLTLNLPVFEENNEKSDKNLESKQYNNFKTKLDYETQKKTSSDKKNDNLVNKSITESKKNNKNSIISNFFSYLIIFIISIVALITLIDTLKSPLIDIFPGLEIILFNLFETLKDIKLFIIDLN